MKRNIAPLLGIAVVVAILSTGVFYGLFAGKLRSASADVPGQPIVVAARDLDRGTVLQAGDLRVSHIKGTLAGSFPNPEQLAGATVIAAVKQNEPLLEERVVSNTSKPGSGSSSVPTGLRAVSIHVSDSDGLLGFLRPGTKVDLQAVEERNGSLQLRTFLQNVEVVEVNPQSQPGGGNRGPVSTVTVLARPEDADVVALADSGARIRLSLRNPLDSATAPRPALGLSSVFQARSSAPLTAPTSGTSGTPDARSLNIDLQVLWATPAAASQLEAKLARPASGTGMAVIPFAEQTDCGGLIEKLAHDHQLEILSKKTLSAGIGRPARFRTGPAAGKLGIVFFTEPAADGKLNLRVQPEISTQSKTGMETHLLDADLPSTGNFLLRGVLNGAGDHDLLQRLYPGQTWSDNQLLIVFSSREDSSRQLSASWRERRR